MFYHSHVNEAIRKAKDRHPATQRCPVCAALDLPAIHPQRIHGDDERCVICARLIDRDGWDSHWRLLHIPRTVGAEDRADWPSHKDH